MNAVSLLPKVQAEVPGANTGYHFGENMTK